MQKIAKPRGNLTYQMLDALGCAIVKGDYAHQPFPTEADLAKRYAVSRSVTREAVKMLTAKGLLTARPRQGTAVLPESEWSLFDPGVLRWLLEGSFSIRLLRQFNELRFAIEPAAAQLAARCATAESLAEINAGLERMIAAEAGYGDPLTADVAFHVAVLSASQNPFFAQFHDMVETALRTSILFTNRFKGQTASIPAHKAVKDAIEIGDGLAAHAAMASIITEVEQFIAAAESQGDEPA